MTPDLAPALAILRRDAPEVAAVYLFGSAAYGADRADSDIDLAIYAGRPLDRGRALDLQDVDLAVAPTILQARAIGDGPLVDARDADAAAVFEIRVMRDYQDLKARRSEIEADIVQRGRVYAG
jgi:predicted nucleotidyltransferase